MRACNCARASPLQSRTCEGCDIAAAIMSEAGLPFQSTHPRGVRLRVSGHVGPRMRSFNPRTRVGCDVRRRGRRSVSRVSIHAPAWGATTKSNPIYNKSKFQSTHPRGVRLLTHYQYVMDKQFQSTHPRGVRRGVIGVVAVGIDVSIHAPAWGATGHKSLPHGVRGVSIHAPAWGATSNYRWRPKEFCHVSIHAPAWGATAADQRQTAERGVSIHAPAWGATGKDSVVTLDVCMFQSTHPRGVRLQRAALHGAIRFRFNPRTRVGCDILLGAAANMLFPVSIHAPAWGATSVWPSP